MVSATVPCALSSGSRTLPPHSRLATLSGREHRTVAQNYAVTATPALAPMACAVVEGTPSPGRGAGGEPEAPHAHGTTQHAQLVEAAADRSQILPPGAAMPRTPAVLKLWGCCFRAVWGSGLHSTRCPSELSQRGVPSHSAPLAHLPQPPAYIISIPLTWVPPLGALGISALDSAGGQDVLKEGGGSAGPQERLS